MHRLAAQPHDGQLWPDSRASRAIAPAEDQLLPTTCANCGTVADEGALFCARCGLNFAAGFKGTPIEQLGEVSDVMRRLREQLGERYAIERELGKGGMATVYLARDVKHDREVAIKVLHPDLSASIGAERFEREIKLAAKLQHPNILGLYDSGTADGLLYYVMPFVRGESLRDRIDREGMLPIEDAVGIALQVASALGYAHANGIVHRDIKPENILLSSDHILVADFGIARATAEAGQQKLTQTGMAVGTPVYMAPEQSTGDQVGPSADIYSLGCMLYEMLTGEPPFTGPNAMAIMAKHLMEQVPSVRVVRQAVPMELEQAIFITLNKQPIDRPQNAQQFAELLGMPLGATGTMRVMRGTAAMRGSQVMRGSTVGRASQFGLPGIPDEQFLPPVPVWKRPITWVVGGGFTLAAAAVLYFALSGGPKAPVNDPDARRVAVLYFQDASRDSSLRPVADGLTEGLIRSLNRVTALQVISRGGVEPYRNARVGIDSIARALRAGYVVHGSLAPENARVRVSLTLSRKTGVPVSDSSFTVARDSIVLAQNAIAGAAADLIRGVLGVQIALQDQRARTSSNEAWVAMQDGAQLMRRAMALQAARDTTGAAVVAFEAADSSFARAEALDRRWPEPATRRAELAYQRSRLVGRDPGAIRPWVNLAIGHADRAVALDPEDPDALEIRGTARYWGVINNLHLDEATRLRELRAAQQDLEGAVDLNPRQAGAYATLSHMYYRLDDKTNDNVLTAAAKALEADEFQSNVVLIRQRLFNAAFDLGRFDAAEQYCADLERLFPGNARAIRCRLYLQSIPTRRVADSVDVARAWRLADSLAATAPDNRQNVLTGTMWVAAALARKSVGEGITPSVAAMLADSARAVAKRSEGDAVIDSPRDLAYFGAYVYTVLGDKADAIRLLDAYIATDPATHQASLRADPTWMFRRLAEDPNSGFARSVGARR